MILIDDLRPALGCYGDLLAVTPHIDALANQSVRFDAAYTSVPTCSPSRTSLLTGLRPDTHGVHDLFTHFRSTVPDVTTLPQAFKRAGYLALSYGKVFHEDLDDGASWSSQADFDDGEGNLMGEDKASCSCLFGNPCASSYNCKDWHNRFEVAKKNGWKGFS